MHVVGSEGTSSFHLDNPDGTQRDNKWFAGTWSNELKPGAQAFLVGMITPHTYLRPHFHDVDQFQVFIGGDGKLGNDPIGPVTVFYTDAWASYGPIIAGDHGLQFLNLRMQHESGIHYMPEDREYREPTPGRRIVTTFDPSEGGNQADMKVPGRLRREVADEHEDGVKVEFVVVGPHTDLAPILAEPTPLRYVVVLDGEIEADGKTLDRTALLYNEYEPAPSQGATADKGAILAVLTFPRELTSARNYN